MKNKLLPTGYFGLVLAVFTLVPAQAGASGLVPGLDGLYGGVGALYTDFDDEAHDSRVGYRLYGGFDVARVPAVLRLGVEGGYTQTGRYELNGATDRLENGDVGLQATLTTIPLLDLHGRYGYEWGDSSGGYGALGASLGVLPYTRLRGEFQWRNEFDAAMLSIQLHIP